MKNSLKKLKNEVLVLDKDIEIKTKEIDVARSMKENYLNIGTNSEKDKVSEHLMDLLHELTLIEYDKLKYQVEIEEIEKFVCSIIV